MRLVHGFYETLMGRLDSCSVKDFGKLSLLMILRLHRTLEKLLSMLGDDSRGTYAAKQKAVIRHKICRLLLQLPGAKKSKLRKKVKLGFKLLK